MMKKYMKSITKQHRKTLEGRYEVQIPFAVNPPNLGESLPKALKRLAAVKRKFKTHPDLHNRYIEFMQEYIDQNHMEPVRVENNPSQ